MDRIETHKSLEILYKTNLFRMAMHTHQLQLLLEMTVEEVGSCVPK